MRLRDLAEQLNGLVARGFGDRPVLDESGNDVARVSTPLAQPLGTGKFAYEDGGVMLVCFIDHRFREQFEEVPADGSS